MVIDFHTHAFPDKIAAATLQSLAVIAGQTPLSEGTVESLSQYLRDAGVDVGVILNIATKPSQMNTINNVACQNDFYLSGNEPFGRFVAFGSVHPDAGQAAVDEVFRIKALGLKGIKLHPDYQNFFIDEKRLYPIYDAISETGLPVVFHAGFDPLSPDVCHASPSSCAKVLADFPKMTAILAHMGGMKQEYETIEVFGTKYDNLWFDTSYVGAPGIFKQENFLKIISMRGEDRILFGSDMPWLSSKTAKEFILSLPICDDAKEKILGLNAARLLNI